jgi:hypothetical protein
MVQLWCAQLRRPVMTSAPATRAVPLASMDLSVLFRFLLKAQLLTR